MIRGFFRPQQGDGAGEEQGRWQPDPARAFSKRYHDGSNFTPFVRLSNQDRVLWDLGYARRRPDQSDLEHIDGIVLQAGGKRIECASDSLRVSWLSPDGSGRMRAVVPLARLVQLELARAAPAVANEDCVELAIRAAPARPVSVSSGESLAISLTFPPEHENSVRELCVFTEWMCGRSLTVTGRTGTKSPIAGAHPQRAKPERSQASDHLLAISAVLIPDNDEWLTFLAPTAQELLTAGMAGDAMPGSSATGPGGSQDFGATHALYADQPPTG